jgi:hypothetical protein
MCKKDGTELCKNPEQNIPCGTCVLLGCIQTGLEDIELLNGKFENLWSLAKKLPKEK